MIALAIAVAIAASGPEPRMCRTVHGEMMTANGNPALRIREIGTRHYLGVDVGQDLSLRTLPANIRRKCIAGSRSGTLIDVTLYGDFRVCGWRPRQAGEMELVRVVSGRNLVVSSSKRRGTR